MFVFEFEGALFRFRLKRPAFDPLLQLPPLSAVALHGLDPATDHTADFIDMPGPDFVPMLRDVSQTPCLADERPQILDLDIEVVKGGFLVVALGGRDGEMQEPVERRPDLGRQDVTLIFRKLQCHLVTVRIKLFQFGEDFQAVEMMRHITRPAPPAAP